MPDYRMVTDAINTLANRVHGISQDRMAFDEKMRGLDLANARIGLQAKTLAGTHDLQMEKLKREQYLDEPITFGDAIQGSKFPDESKASLLQQFKPILNIPTTRRKAGEGLFNYMKQIQATNESEDKRKSAEKQAQLDREASAEQGRLNRASREKIAGMTTPNDKRSTMQKEVEFIQEVTGLSSKEALDKYQKDKTLPERIRLYTNELDRLAGDFDFQALDENQKAEKISKLRESYQIPVSESGVSNKQLTRDKAIEYMRQANGDKEKAKQLAQKDGYQF